VEVVPLALPGVLLVRPRVHGDARGWFMETWERERYAAAGIGPDFVQDNHSRSARGVLRGLHYQVVEPQGKLVRVLRGAVFDVAVDLRRSSPTFGRWVGQRLDDVDHAQLWVPPGFAHGFLALTEVAEIAYRCTTRWQPAHDRVLAWDDPALAIDWPLASGARPSLSDKDARAPRLGAAEVYP
jgi:dTDP-4-dehydrorhamnose 3,5-epimerase